MTYFGYALAAVLFFTIYMAVAHSLKRDKLKVRIDDADLGEQDEYEKKSMLSQFCSAILSLLGIDIKKQKELLTEIARAGIHSDNAAMYILFFKRIMQPLFLVAALMVVLHMITHNISGPDGLEYIFSALLLAIIGISGTTFFLDYTRKKYHQALELSTPEAMDLMLICIESGLALDAALNRVCTEMKSSHPQLIRQLDRTRIELSVLNDRVQALQNLSDRTGVFAIRSLVAAIIQTERFGTSLVETLRVLAEDQREERMLKIEQKAARIPVIITLPLILFIIPALFIIILGPPILGINAQGGLGAIMGGGAQ